MNTLQPDHNASGLCEQVGVSINCTFSFAAQVQAGTKISPAVQDKTVPQQPFADSRGF